MPKGDPAGYLPRVQRSRRRGAKPTSIAVPPGMRKPGKPPVTTPTQVRHFGTAPSSTPRFYKTRKRRAV